jgi:hypothetical protein
MRSSKGGGMCLRICDEKAGKKISLENYKIIFERHIHIGGRDLKVFLG